MRLKIKALIAKSELNSHLNEQRLLKNESARLSCLNEMEKLRQEIVFMTEMIGELDPSGELDKAELLMLRKRQAVFRKKIANLDMQIAQKKGELQTAEKEKERLITIRIFLHKKIDKYQKLLAILRQRKRLRDLYSEETDTEEKLSWK